MTTVREMLRFKGSDVWSVPPTATVYDALRVMADKNIGAVLVVEAGRVVGILSERDYARKVVLYGRSSKETAVGDIMTERVVYVRPEQNAEDCMAVMTDKHVRHLPVLDGERLLGVISIGDVVKSIIADREFTIEQLEQYITGASYQTGAAGW